MSSNVSLKISERVVAMPKAIDIPKTIDIQSTNTQKENEKVSLYIQQLTEQQKIVLNIAKEHLATSFCIEKSLGYLNWLKTQ